MCNHQVCDDEGANHNYINLYKLMYTNIKFLATNKHHSTASLVGATHDLSHSSDAI